MFALAMNLALDEKRVKLWLHRQFFTRDCNAIFRSYCAAIKWKKLQTGFMMCWKNLHIVKLPGYSEFLLLLLQFFESCNTASAKHPKQKNYDV